MVTISTTSFNIDELYTLPLESVCFIFPSLRGRTGNFVHCLRQPQASKGYYRMLASKFVTSEFIFRNNPVWFPSGLPAILSEVLCGLPRNFPDNAGKDKTKITNPWHKTLKICASQAECPFRSCGPLCNHLKHNGNFFLGFIAKKVCTACLIFNIWYIY